MQPRGTLLGRRGQWSEVPLEGLWRTCGDAISLLWSLFLDHEERETKELLLGNKSMRSPVSGEFVLLVLLTML